MFIEGWGERGLPGPPQPGNRFVSFVRARGVRCLVKMSLKGDPLAFPFSLSAQEAFPFPFL